MLCLAACCLGLGTPTTELFQCYGNTFVQGDTHVCKHGIALVYAYIDGTSAEVYVHV